MRLRSDENRRANAELEDTDVGALQCKATDVHARCRLAYRLLLGIDVEPDLRRALRLYHVAAAEGCPAAAYNLSVCHLRGVGVPASLALSVRWAAECERIMHMDESSACDER